MENKLFQEQLQNVLLQVLERWILYYTSPFSILEIKLQLNGTDFLNLYLC